jgi:hypothetical protein
MADIEIGPLHDHLEDAEIAELAKALEKAGAPKLPKSDEGAANVIGRGIDDDVLAEFLDRLDAHDLACDFYLPIDFEVRVQAADYTIGSASMLIDVLDEMRDDLMVEDDEEEEEEEDDEEYEEDEEEEDDEPGEMELVEAQLRQLWKLFYKAAHAAVDRGLPMWVRQG